MAKQNEKKREPKPSEGGMFSRQSSGNDTMESTSGSIKLQVAEGKRPVKLYIGEMLGEGGQASVFRADLVFFDNQHPRKEYALTDFSRRELDDLLKLLHDDSSSQEKIELHNKINKNLVKVGNCEKVELTPNEVQVLSGLLCKNGLRDLCKKLPIKLESVIAKTLTKKNIREFDKHKEAVEGTELGSVEQGFLNFITVMIAEDHEQYGILPLCDDILNKVTNKIQLDHFSKYEIALISTASAEKLEKNKIYLSYNKKEGELKYAIISSKTEEVVKKVVPKELYSEGLSLLMEGEELTEKERGVFNKVNILSFVAKSEDIPLPPKLPPHELIKILSEVHKGICSLSEKKIAHCDIKPDNIGLRNGAWVILDFGAAVSRDEFVHYQEQKKLSVVSPTNLSSRRQRSLQRFSEKEEAADAKPQEFPNTPFYSAPEIIAKQGVFDAHAIDIYALGVMMLELLGEPNPISRTLSSAGDPITKEMRSEAIMTEKSMQYRDKVGEKSKESSTSIGVDFQSKISEWNKPDNLLQYMKELATWMTAVLPEDRPKQEAVSQAIKSLSHLLNHELDLQQQKEIREKTSESTNSSSPALK